MNQRSNRATLRTLHLPLKGIYFDQIKAGTKTEEFRLANAFWTRRLAGREYDQIVLTRGYPAASDTERRLVLPWRGYTLKTIQHEHFGPQQVQVFAIRVAAVSSSDASPHQAMCNQHTGGQNG